MIIMHMKHVRHTLYSVELLPENMPTKESRISVKKTNACGMKIYDYVTGIITCIDICHIHIVIKISPYVCNNNNFILSPSILTCLFCINHAYTRILSIIYSPNIREQINAVKGSIFTHNILMSTIIYGSIW